MREQRRNFCFLEAGLACLIALVAGCAAGSAPPLPAGDFSLSVSPTSASALVGSTTTNILVSTTSQNGFAGTVNISLQGIPSGITAMPAASFPVPAGSSQSLTFSVSNSAPVGPATITVLGASGTLSHTAHFPLALDPPSPTTQTPPLSYLETRPRQGHGAGWT